MYSEDFKTKNGSYQSRMEVTTISRKHISERGGRNSSAITWSGAISYKAHMSSRGGQILAGSDSSWVSVGLVGP